MTPFSAILIGDESLTRQCGEVLLARGHQIAAVVSRNADVRDWAAALGLRVEVQGSGLAQRLAGVSVDWLLSIANLVVIPPEVLALARKGAVNFHDGPLPAYAGLNAPVWAILNGEVQHGISWHLMEGGIDEGDVLEQRLFAIAEGDSALAVNSRCFEAALESFPALMAQLEGGLRRQAQDLTRRSVYPGAARPATMGRIDFARSGAEIARLVRGLDHGPYWNPLTVAKIATSVGVLAVDGVELAEGQGAPGAVLAVGPEGVTVACAGGAVRLSGLRGLDGRAVAITDRMLASPSADEAAVLSGALAAVAPGEAGIRGLLTGFQAASFAEALGGDAATRWEWFPLQATLEELALAIFRLTGQGGLAFAGPGPVVPEGYLSDWVPVVVPGGETLAEMRAGLARGLARARKYPAFPLDLGLRDGRLSVAVPQVGLSELGGPIRGTVMTATTSGLHIDAARLPGAAAVAARLLAIVEAVRAGRVERLADIPLLAEAERARALFAFNQTAVETDGALTVHAAFEAQVARGPDAVALVCDDASLSYAGLNRAANRAAHRLIAMGVRPGMLVGLCTRRSLDMVVGALAIQKAGAAYVPIDPGYPADRIALYIEDSACAVIVTQTALVADLPAHRAQVLCLDADPGLALMPESNPETGVGPGDLAYVIYTSGSTGRPKGVMVEHRNVTNFFAGMDARIGTEPGTWLAVTSLSFDISVLELFWTLARGFKVVVSSDENRGLVSAGPVVSGEPMEFSLYYWGNDDGVGSGKYKLLLEGAKFADTNGFCAVWTPERHFHAFGGPYPNPAVTGAAVAAVTSNIGVRGGSCVMPLHHPIRIAEEWAVIDNLTNGRAGIAVASGWHPDDFVLRPENTPPANKVAMFETADQVRKLWRGEQVEFPTKTGSLSLLTQPRPVSKELPLWVTTAGNPETWREAGAFGANILTHLLGQTIDEVAGKIKLYHQALRDAGHDPAKFTVTLMLHSYIAASRDEARETARVPMKNYLRSAAALIKQYAWAFPAFKKPQGVSNPMDIDIGTLSAEEMDAILDFAFQRYFEDSGLFGTVEDALARVEALKRIGVGEIACLIDYGIATDTVLQSLRPLAEVLRRANAGGAAADDFSIAAQMVRHRVSHLQCTPSMARMIAMNADSRAALGGVSTLMLGGEALPSALVSDLQGATSARILNMYGPTETTIWSSTEVALAQGGVVNIGTPIANTQFYILDGAGEPVPPGGLGELWIGGAGVTRGYWQRADLTADRFREDRFTPVERAAAWGARIYGTGDLVRLRDDGRLDFLGRADHQVKLRGYRIELGEIEAALEALAGVRQAVVLAREDVPGDLRLVAYVVGAADVAGLRAALAGQLPEHMIPAHFVAMAALPLTPNRKVDRKALPKPGDVVDEVAVEPLSGNAVEARLAAIWSRVLGVAKIGPRDSFFALGGHSLLAVQVHREIRAEMGAASLSITDIFRFPTLAALARHLEVRPAVAAEPPANDRADARADAMARRLAMRQGRSG